MRTEISCVALLLGAMGIVTCAAASENAAGVAEKRGLPPIGMTMLIMDMPDMPPHYAQVMLVQASQSQQTKAQYDRTIGVCHQ